MHLQEALEVQVGHLLAVLHAEQSSQRLVGNDAALELGVKATVGLHVLGNELGHIRLALLRLGRQTHELRQLIRDGAELQERVVRATSLPRGTLLRRHRGGILANTTLGVASLTLQGLRSGRRIRN